MEIVAVLPLRVSFTSRSYRLTKPSSRLVWPRSLKVRVGFVTLVTDGRRLRPAYTKPHSITYRMGLCVWLEQQSVHRVLVD